MAWRRWAPVRLAEKTWPRRAPLAGSALAPSLRCRALSDRIFQKDPDGSVSIAQACFEWRAPSGATRFPKNRSGAGRSPAAAGRARPPSPRARASLASVEWSRAGDEGRAKPLRFRVGSPLVPGRRSVLEPAATNLPMTPRDHPVPSRCAPHPGGGSSSSSALRGRCRAGRRSQSRPAFAASQSASLPASCRGLGARQEVLTGLSRPPRQPRLSGFRQAENPEVISAVSRRDSPGSAGGTCVAVLAARNGLRTGRNP